MTEPDRFHPTSFTTITVEIDEAAKVAVVTLDRPEEFEQFLLFVGDFFSVGKTISDLGDLMCFLILCS